MAGKCSLHITMCGTLYRRVKDESREGGRWHSVLRSYPAHRRNLFKRLSRQESSHSFYINLIYFRGFFRVSQIPLPLIYRLHHAIALQNFFFAGITEPRSANNCCLAMGASCLSCGNDLTTLFQALRWVALDGCHCLSSWRRILWHRHFSR